LDTALLGSPSARLRFDDPANATAGQIDVAIGLPSAATGTYALDATCGSADLIVTLPAPDPSVCATDADSFDCPPGCQSTGSLGSTCTPIPPMLTYAALGPSDCLGDAVTPTGAWTLKLTSLTRYAADAGADGPTDYQAHGTLTATLADVDPDAGTSGVTLTLAF
ncbi:MAG TPA: hypothetical protein VHO06_13815, partial [Polyangia bacterium]|nr:hypothetical protein [Polyangia bacterium]